MTRDVSRRGFLRGVLAGSAAVTAGAAAGAARGTTPIRGRWYQHGGDAANTNRTDDRGPQYNQRTRWREDLPSTDSAPLVAEETVAILELSSEGPRIHALYASTGTTRWRASVPGSVVSGMLGTDTERVVTATVLEPQVVAFDRRTGERRWLADLGQAEEEPQLGVPGGFRTSPLVRDGRLYLKSRAGSSAPASVVALDAATGEVEATVPVQSTHVAVGADRVVGSRGSAFLDDHGLEEIDLDDSDANGELRYGTDGRPGRPTIGDDLVFVGTSENRLHAVDADWETAWTADTTDWAVSLAVADGVVLAKSGERLLAFDAATGERLWSAPAGAPRPVVGSGVAYVGRENGFDGYDVGSGERVVTYRNRLLQGEVSHLSIAGGALLATAQRGAVLAVQEQIDLPARF